jgi:hypothetical protein
MMSCIRFPTTSSQTMLPLALIDHGANGGVAGSDTWLIDKSLCSVHIQGIDNHMIKDVPDQHCRCSHQHSAW